jgi:hypothetical protein
MRPYAERMPSAFETDSRSVPAPIVVAVNLVHLPTSTGRHASALGRSGIDKRPVTGRVGVHGGADPGLDGDWWPIARTMRPRSVLYAYAGRTPTGGRNWPATSAGMLGRT